MKKAFVPLSLTVGLLLIATLWGSGMIPKQIGRIWGCNYVQDQFPELNLNFEKIEWNQFYGDYVITFRDQEHQTVSFVLYPKFFPSCPGQGTFPLQEYSGDNQETCLKDLRDDLKDNLANDLRDNGGTITLRPDPDEK